MRLACARVSVRWMRAVLAVVGLASGITVESGRRRQRFFSAYRGHAPAEYECSIKARNLFADMRTEGTYRPFETSGLAFSDSRSHAGPWP
jgi:hypothetical protein